MTFKEILANNPVLRDSLITAGSYLCVFFISWLLFFNLIQKAWLKFGVEMNTDLAFLIGLVSTTWTMYSFPGLLLDFDFFEAFKFWVYLQVDVFFMSIALDKISK